MATESTREALWDAVGRKEIYSTSGTRIIVRFLGGSSPIWYTP